MIPALVILLRTYPTKIPQASETMKRTIATVISVVEAWLPLSTAAKPPNREQRMRTVKKVTAPPIEQRTHSKYFPPKRVTRAPKIKRTVPIAHGLLEKYLMIEVTWSLGHPS